MAAAQLGPIAKHYEIADVPVSLFGITAAALPFALSLDRVLNGVSRPFFGWVSDHLGRENTLGVALVLEGLAILLFINYVRVPAMFVILTGLTFFAWGEIYSLFPALCGDLFGRKYATTNYGLLYTAKGTAALLVPLGSLIQHVRRKLEAGVHRGLRLRLHRGPAGALCPQAVAAALARKVRRGRRRRARSWRGRHALGARKCAATLRRCTLPVAVRGMASTIWMVLGVLNSARRSRQKRRQFILAGLAARGSTTAAATSSPQVRCGTPKQTASATAGCCK